MTCSNHNHPEGDHLPYLAHLEWLELMSKTHRQIKCPTCGLYKIWRLK